MKPANIPWNKGSWASPPQSNREDGDCLIVEAAEGSDYWEKTLYGFQHGSGHSLLAVWPDSIDGMTLAGLAYDSSDALRAFIMRDAH